MKLHKSIFIYPKSLLNSLYKETKIRVTSPDNNDFPQQAFVLLVIIVIIHVAFRLLYLTSYSLWGGETFIIDGIRQDWPDMFTYIISDVVHPPLIYILLKFWTLIGGSSLLWLKIYTLLFGIAAIVPLFLLCRELGLQPSETNLALFLFVVNGFLIHYAQEVRMYSMLLFFGLLSFWLFIRFLNSENSSLASIIWLFVVNLLLVNSHYFGWIILALEVGTALFWRRRKLLLFCGLVILIVLTYIPWLYLAFNGAVDKGGLDRNLSWIPRPTVQTFVNLLADFNGIFLVSGLTKVVGLILLGFPILLWAWRVVWNSPRDEAYDKLFWWLTFAVFSPLVVVYVGSQFMAQSYFIDRYFIFITPLYMILVSVAAFRLHPKWLRYSVVTTIVVWVSLAGFSDAYTNRVAWTNPEVGSRVRWGQVAQQLIDTEASAQNEIKIYTLWTWSENRPDGDWAIKISLRYQFKLRNEERFQLKYAGTPRELVNLAAEESHFWVAFFELENSKSEALLKSVLTNNGYRFGRAIRETQSNNQLILLPVWSQQSESQPNEP